MTASRIGQELPPLELENATGKDVEALMAIDRDSKAPWTRDAFESELGALPPTVHVLKADGAIVGFVITRSVGVEMDIVNLAVSPACRGRGYGRAMTRRLIELSARRGIRKAYLEVRESNAAARGLYRSLGFGETQRRRNFYRDPQEDAILMSLEIEP